MYQLEKKFVSMTWTNYYPTKNGLFKKTRPEPIQINLISYLSARLYIMVGHKDWPIVTLKSNPNQNKRATKWTQKNYRGPRPLPWSHTHSPSMRTLVHSTPFPHFPTGAHVSPFIKWWIGAHCAVFQTRKKIVWPVYTRHVSLQKKKEKEKEKEKERKKKKKKKRKEN